jgi:hypothetical protein
MLVIRKIKKAIMLRIVCGDTDVKIKPIDIPATASIIINKNVQSEPGQILMLATSKGEKSKPAQPRKIPTRYHDAIK